ncbi:MAG: hypothetical protein QNK79_06265 [Synechococcus sp. ArSW.bin.68]
MTSLLPVRLSPLLLGLAILAPCAVRAQLKYVPFPTKSELRSLQLLAYACSRENNVESCTRTREIANPLMDHPRLPTACKDAVWELLQETKPATTNSSQRRDSIDSPARRLTVVCADPAKPSKPNNSPSAGSQPSQT